MDPGARLRPGRHGGPARPQTRDRRGDRPGDRAHLGRRTQPGAAADRRDLPGRDDRDRRARLRRRRGRLRVRLPRRLPDRPRARLGTGPRPPHDRRLPRGRRLGRPDRPLRPARPARLPEHARRGRARGPGALCGADPASPAPSPPSRRRCSRRFGLRERAMLGWAGLRGATPIWLATFPVVAGVDAGGQLFSIVFFVVVTSTLVQGASFEPLARRLGPDHRRARPAAAAARVGTDPPHGRRRRRLPAAARARRRQATSSASWACRARRSST